MIEYTYLFHSHYGTPLRIEIMLSNERKKLLYLRTVNNPLSDRDCLPQDTRVDVLGFSDLADAFCGSFVRWPFPVRDVSDV